MVRFPASTTSGASPVSTKASLLGLQPPDFYVDAHQKLFETILFLSQKGQSIDLITLSVRLKDRGWYEQIGGGIFLTTLFDDCFSIGHAASYSEIVKHQAILRRVIQTAAEMTAQAMKGAPDTDDFLDDIERKVFAISDSKTPTSSSSMRDILINNLQTIEDLSLKKSDIIGLPTGFRAFDQLTGGLRAGQLMILAARPAMGKTSLFLSISQNVVTQNKNAVVLVFSLEMSKDELGFRLLSGNTKIPASRLKVGNLSADDWPRLLGASTYS